MADKAKMLERVRALLAKAASTRFPEEADTFRAKADEIMTNYAIEQWQVDAAESARGARPMPERRDFDFSWYRGNPFQSQLWSLFNSVASHCRCQAIGPKVDWGEQKCPVIGLRSDLDWFDLLFTNLMIAMMRQIDPQPDADLDLNENMALMREAGLPWVEALNRIVRAGIVDGDIDEQGRVHDGKRAYFSRAVYERTIRSYRSWCKRTGHEQSKVSQRTFRGNFSDGFVAEINDRLFLMSRQTEQKYDASHSANSMALAVRDIKEVIQEFIFEEWPELKPHPSNCHCEQCRRIRAQMRKPVRYRQDKRPVDYGAIQAGRAAGKKVDLTNNPSDRIGSRREIGS